MTIQYFGDILMMNIEKVGVLVHDCSSYESWILCGSLEKKEVIQWDTFSLNPACVSENIEEGEDLDNGYCDEGRIRSVMGSILSLNPAWVIVSGVGGHSGLVKTQANLQYNIL